jgi:LysR family transcriptional regulator, benzoate and cis,cis-muconate-responsive activator of ben and cat genes
MKLNQLEGFVVLAEELHYGRAADRLHLSQPPLTRQIQALEAELGIELFLRSTQRVTLTDAGRVFLHELRPALARLAQAAAAAQRAARGDLGDIAVGVTGSAMFGIVPAILKEFRRRFPGVSLELRQSPKGEQIRAIKEHRITIGFVRSLTRDDDLAHDLILQEPLLVAMAADHPLTRRAAVRLGDLAEEGFILYRGQTSPSIADQITQLCHEAGFSPRVVQKAEDMQSAAALAALGFGVTLVAASLRQMKLRDLAYRRLAGAQPPQTQLYAAYRKHDPSPVLKAFRALCREISGAGDRQALIQVEAEVDAPHRTRSRGRGR